MNNVVFRKAMENVRKQRYQACNNQARRNYLVSELSYNITKLFSENVLAIEMRKKYKYL